MPHLGILTLQFEKTITIFDISILEFVKAQSFEHEQNS